LIIALAGAALLSNCAAAPRAPAASLAEAGIKATGSFSQEVSGVAAQLGNVEVGEAFTATWEQCSNPKLTCEEIVEPAELSAERRELARVVGLRARALEALGKAYAALQTEAAYDQSADLSGAAGDAVKAADSFAAAAAGLRKGSTPLTVPAQVASLAEFGFGILGEQLQRKRILAASRDIARATLQVRNGMIDESAAFGRLTDYLVRKRTAVRMTLMSAGLVSRADVMQQVADQLNVKLVPGFASAIASSRADQMALQASMRALAQQEVLATKERYQAGIAALGALLQSHAQLEKGEPFSIASVERFLTQLDATLEPDPAPEQ
jgi:hypothetical protein